jgi:hypothetical protein
MSRCVLGAPDEAGSAQPGRYRMTHAANADSFLSRFRGYRPLGRSEAPLAPSPASAGFSFGTDCLVATCLAEQTPLPRVVCSHQWPRPPRRGLFCPAVPLFQPCAPSHGTANPMSPRTAAPQQAFSNNSPNALGASLGHEAVWYVDGNCWRPRDRRLARVTYVRRRAPEAAKVVFQLPRCRGRTTSYQRS